MSSQCSWPWNWLSISPRTRCYLITDASRSSSSGGCCTDRPGAHPTLRTHTVGPRSCAQAVRCTPVPLPPAGGAPARPSHACFPGGVGLAPRHSSPVVLLSVLVLLGGQNVGHGSLPGPGAGPTLGPQISRHGLCPSLCTASPSMQRHGPLHPPDVQRSLQQR